MQPHVTRPLLCGVRAVAFMQICMMLIFTPRALAFDAPHPYSDEAVSVPYANANKQLPTLGSQSQPVLSKAATPCDPSGLLTNCSFETGDFTGWIVSDLVLPFEPIQVVPAGHIPFFVTWSPGLVTIPTDGDFSVVHGFDGDGPGTIELAQEVSLWSNTTTLEFDYRGGWELATYGATLDRTFQVDIEPVGGGAPLQSTPILTALAGTIETDTGPLVGAVDVSAFAGQRVRIVFRWWVPEPTTGPAFFEIDNVSLNGSDGPDLANPSFESGSFPDWTPTGGGLGSPPLGVYAAGSVGGAWGASFPSDGAFNVFYSNPILADETWSLQQDVVLSAYATTLNFDYYIATLHIFVSGDLTLEVDIEPAGGGPVLQSTLIRSIPFGSQEPSAIYLQASVDLAPFRGEAVRIILRAFIPTSLTDVAIDNFTIFETADPLNLSVEDVPDDQGHWVRLSFLASRLDAMGTLTGYNAWREIATPMAQTVRENGAPSQELAALGAMEWDGRTFVLDRLGKGLNSFPPGDWELVTGFFAAQRTEYQVVLPTVVDDVPIGFFVSAHTTDPLVWYGSLPQSGTSIDNLPPGVPAGIVAGYSAAGVDLSWDLAPEEDFQFWRVYRSTDPGFTPLPADLVTEVDSPSYTDPTAAPWGFYYKVSAVDHAGNEGEAGEPTTVTANEELPALSVVLHRPIPNPFNPTTTIAFDLPQQGQVRVSIYNAAGRYVATLEDGDRLAGLHEVTWYGRTDGGAPVASGVYIVRLEAGGRTLSQSVTLIK